MPDSRCTLSPDGRPRSTTDWQRWPTGVGRPSADVDEGLAILRSADDELLDLLAASFRIRRGNFGKHVQLYFLMNAKSGLCPEDCGYCSQSKVSEAEIPRYNLLNAEKLLDAARVAAERQAKTYCIVISARGPSQREMDAITRIVPQIKSHYNLKICACLGLLTPDQARQLKACGVDRVNHNLNTSEAALRRNLLDPHLSRPRRHPAGRPRCRHGALLRRHHRHGRGRRRRGADGFCPARAGRPNRSRSIF